MEDKDAPNKDEAHHKHGDGVTTGQGAGLPSLTDEWMRQRSAGGICPYTLIPGVSSMYIRIMPALLPERAAAEGVPFSSALRRLLGGRGGGTC